MRSVSRLVTARTRRGGESAKGRGIKWLGLAEGKECGREGARGNEWANSGGERELSAPPEKSKLSLT